MVPSLQNLGYQALSVGSLGAESSPENALSEINEFGVKKPSAKELIKQVAAAVDSWADHSRQLGVCPADMEHLAASIDRDALRLQRQEYL